MENTDLLLNIEKEIKGNTNLLFSGIDINDYSERDGIEYLTLDFCFVTTGNIITFAYAKESNTLSLVDYACYSVKDVNNFNGPQISSNAIMKLYDVARKFNKPFIKQHTIEKRF